MIKIILALLMLSVFYINLCAQEFFPIWPEGRMPNTRHLALKDSVANERIYQVGTPGVYAFLPSKDDNSGAAVLIFPGGGYTHLTYNLGGFQLAKWFNTLGISAFVVKYRMPNSPDLVTRETGPLIDAQRAIKFVKYNAVKWAIDTSRIGVQGSSAGGHLAALAGTSVSDLSSISDPLDAYDTRPSFMILVSPVIDLGSFAHKGSRNAFLGDNPSDLQIEKYSAQNLVAENTPVCFIAHAFDDAAVPAQNSLLFYQALYNKKVSASLHIFPHGGHAINVNNTPGSAQLWKSLCEMWMQEMGILVYKKK